MADYLARILCLKGQRYVEFKGCTVVEGCSTNK